MKSLCTLLFATGISVAAYVVAASAANALPPDSVRYHYNNNCQPVWRTVIRWGHKPEHVLVDFKCKN